MKLTITAARYLTSIRHELGTKESPANSNRTPYGRAFGWNGVPWCAIFVIEMLKAAGQKDIVKQLCPQGGGTMLASTIYLRSALLRSGGKSVPIASARPGDIVFWGFPVTGSIRGRINHVSTFERHVGRTVRTLDGNSGPASENNGGEVCRRDRSRTYVVDVIRLPWAGKVKSVALKVGAASTATAAAAAVAVGAALGGGTPAPLPAPKPPVVAPAPAPTPPVAPPSVKPPVVTPKPSPAPKVILRRILGMYSCGKDVALLNARFKVTGSCFTTKTRTAVLAFQGAHRLTRDALVGEHTALALGWTWAG